MCEISRAVRTKWIVRKEYERSKKVVYSLWVAEPMCNAMQNMLDQIRFGVVQQGEPKWGKMKKQDQHPMNVICTVHQYRNVQISHHRNAICWRIRQYRLYASSVQ